jgi:hypothetical protein
MLQPLQMTAAANDNCCAAAATPSRTVGLKVGNPAPTYTLPDLCGKLVSLSGSRGSQTLVLFSGTSAVAFASVCW